MKPTSRFLQGAAVLLWMVLLLGCPGGSAWAGVPVWGIDAAPPLNQTDVSPDRMLVKFAPNASEAVVKELIRQVGMQRVRELHALGITILKTKAKRRTLHRVMTALRKSRVVEFVEPDYRIHLNGMPNDPRFNELWAMHNTGQVGGLPDADIDAPEAWDLNSGDANVVVAVIDTGVDYLHEDLQGNLWQNPDEIPANGVDDDGNGFVDDVYGINAITESGDPMDDNGHGTHVAGTIGAVGNNQIGVTGVNWSTRIMALKFMDQTGSGWTSDAVECLNYVLMMRNRGVSVQVINSSWGGPSYSQTLYDAIRMAGTLDILFVTAAGNDYGSNNDILPSYPGSYNLPNIITVAATDRNDQLADFSNFGATSVDLAAPGVDILSTTPANTYAYYSGTSMAAPHVTGAAALVWAKNPVDGYDAVKSILLDSVDPLPVLSGRVLSGGRLNLVNALSGTFSSRSYDLYLSYTGDSASHPPVHDCATFTATQMCLDSCGGCGSLIRRPVGGSPLNLKIWIGQVPCGNRTLHFMGTSIDGSVFPDRLHAIGGWGIDPSNGEVLGVEGIENPACTLIP